MTDIPICGLRTPEGMCTEPRELSPNLIGDLFPDGQVYRERCADHAGMPADVRPEPGPFANQQPSFEPATAVRSEFVKVVGASIRHAADAGLLVLGGDERTRELVVHRIASMVIDDLAADTLGKTLQGMATGQMAP